MDVIELASRPIDGPSPAGVDAKYELEYEALTAEIAKLSSMQIDPPGPARF